MKQSMRIATVSGIKISVHWTFLLLLLWVVVSTYRQTNSMSEAGLATLFIFVLFVCIVLHELGHAITAKSFNIRTRSIVLLPIGGVAQMEELPEKPEQELLIAFAGPLVNMVIAGLLYGILYWQNDLPGIQEAGLGQGKNFLFTLLSANVVLALFNLIPAFPMDGGRMLRAILGFYIDRDKATRIAAFIGQLVAVGFVLVGLFYNPFLALVGIFIFLGAKMESDYVHSKFLLQAYQIKDILLSRFYSLEPTNTVNDAVRMLLNVQAKDFLVMDHGKVKGTLNREDIIKALSEKGGNTAVEQAMNSEFVSFRTDDQVDKMYHEIQKGKQSIFPVFSDGTLAGAVDLENVTELLLVNEAKRLSAGASGERPNSLPDQK